MRMIVGSFLVAFLATFADSPDPPISNTRLPVSTLVREDVFAGWMEQDMERFARAEKNLDLLIDQRPRVKDQSLAWKGATKIYRAVLAHEAGKEQEFDRYFQEARQLFGEAKRLGPKNGVVNAVVGGSYGLFADRLPEEHRAAAWAETYDNYDALWQQQSRVVDRLPLHIKGELLAGLAQSAQRTGRKEEFGQYLDKIIEVLPDSHYDQIAREWKADPSAASTGSIMCNYCHEPGRLSARMAKLKAD